MKPSTFQLFNLSTLAAFALASASAKAAEPFVIARRGADACCGIVIPTNSGECVRYAASELQKYTKRMTGVVLPVIDEGSLVSPPPRAVYLGVDNSTCSTRLKNLDAFLLCVSNGNLRVTGGGSRGVLYGVYELLERFGGCGWFAPWCEKVPEREAFEVPGDLDFSDSPAFEARWASWRQTLVNRDRESKDFSAKMRFNSAGEARYGGAAVKYAGGLQWDGSIGRIVPIKEHFKEHPEWFCEIGGKRRENGAWQICYSSTGVVAFVTQRVKEILRKNPGANAICIAQNDFQDHCLCASCVAAAREDGATSGPTIRFANAVAEEVEKEFPGVMIATFAYQWTRFPPKAVKPRDNVMVVLCTFENSFTAPIETSDHPNTARFRDMLRGWNSICRNIRIYDYCTNFRNYLFPFPDLHSLVPNYRFFRDNGVRWLYSQGCGDGFHAESEELRCWVQGKLMWNPDQPVEPLIDRFLEGYYGAAAPFVREYYRRLYAAFGVPVDDTVDPEIRPAHGGIYSENLPWLDDAFLADALALWKKAEDAVKDDPATLNNVRMGELPVLYISLKRFYERGWKTVWAAEDLTPHIAAMEETQKSATAFIEVAREARRGLAFAEDWGRHKLLNAEFGRLAKGDWTPPMEGSRSASITTNDLERGRFGARMFPLRQIAVDQGAKYRIRVRLRRKTDAAGSAKDAPPASFKAGFRIDWLEQAQGTLHKTIPFASEAGRDADGFAWYELGEYDISALQKIPRPTMNGLCLYIQGDVEIERIEIAKVK